MGEGGSGGDICTLFPLQTVLPTTIPLQASLTVIPPPLRPRPRPPPIKILIVAKLSILNSRMHHVRMLLRKNIYLCCQTTLLSCETSGFTAMTLWQVSRQNNFIIIIIFTFLTSNLCTQIWESWSRAPTITPHHVQVKDCLVL